MAKYIVKFELIIKCKSTGFVVREMKKPNKQVDSRCSIMNRVLNAALIQLLIRGIEWVLQTFFES
jgi:hypothetical protein